MIGPRRRGGGKPCLRRIFPAVVQKIRDGKTSAIGALIGPVMKATRGQADAARVHQLILDRLDQS